MKLNKNMKLKLFEKMLLVRRFEEEVYRLATRGFINGSVHLCIGEEAAAVGTVLAIDKNDYILPTHRGHGQILAKGTNPKKLMAEILGKETGLCKGRVGSMHVFDKDNKNLGAQGILGAQFPISVGVGLALKLKKLKNIVLCFFGDGTSNQGTFYEALNLADIWELPILFVCINNFYGMGTHYKQTSNVDIYKKAAPFNIITETADGNNVKEVFSKTNNLVQKMKEKRRPALLECYTYRWLGHSSFDNRPYRSKEEINEWKKKDPIKRFEKEILEEGIAQEEIEEIKSKVQKEIDSSSKFAIDSDVPIFDPATEL